MAVHNSSPMMIRLVARFGAAVMLGAGTVAPGCDEAHAHGHAAPLKVLATIGEVGLSPGQFDYPRAIDNDGESIWVIDKAARVQRLDVRTGRCTGGWKMPDYILGKPTGITIAPGAGGEQVLYVADTHYHRVMVYRAPAENAAPELLGTVGSFGEGPGQFIYPTDVAVLLDEAGREPRRMYVSEYGGNDRISAFDAKGPNQFEFAFTFGHFGDSAAAETVQFNRPQSMAIDVRKKELIVTDACNHRIGRFTLDGKLISWVCKAGAGAGELRYPYGLILLDDGSAMVSEYGNNRVQRVDVSTGASLGIFGVPGRGEGELASPWGLTRFKGSVYVLDSGNNRVQSFKEPG